MASQILVPLFDRLQLQLGEAVQLYRRVLRVHRTQLGSAPMRDLADKFARAEFRSHMAAASEAASAIASASECQYTGGPEVTLQPTNSKGSHSPRPEGGFSDGSSNAGNDALPIQRGTGCIPSIAVQEIFSGKGRFRQAEKHPTGCEKASPENQAPWVREVTEAEKVSKQLELFTEAWREYLAFADNRSLRRGRHLRPAQRELLSDDQKQQLQSIKQAQHLFRQQLHKPD
ncbi:hypothetical protein TGRUB_363310 [Toxoplasma gondii RUB]|uniref:Succinate dehydrogenase assembly factor 3 n=1 Tax=Toxoplasma gondii RUB TaxID=935652 RepID=A0A086LL28_TOXGO|nr:hypothetical protein TGRUB_363310 [Toxoplasma gondii RUB]